MIISKSKYYKLVSEAYAEQGGSSHVKIQKKFQDWIGKSKVPFWQRPNNKFQHYVLKTVRQLAEEASEPDLGFNRIGFEALKIHCLKTDANSASVYLFGMSHNYPVFELYQKYISPFSTAVDIGANIGMHSLVMAALCGDKGQVYAFEPSIAIFERLQENIQVNRLDNVMAINKAVGNEEGEIGFDDNSQSANIGTSRVDRLLVTKVPICTLDDEITEPGRISLVKIDVEGFERDVLKGAARILATHKPAVVLEFNPESYSLSELMRTIPFTVHIYVIRNNLYTDSEQIVKDNRIIVDIQNERNILILPVDTDLPDPNHHD